MRFIDLFAGLGGFHLALRDLGHECVFASEIDEELQAKYKHNFPKHRNHVFGDIRLHKAKIPQHDILCAGFPCQPFSKSGNQNGRRDRSRGTLFYEIEEILRVHSPQFVILENVGNFERHNNGRTWAYVKSALTSFGYYVHGTTHKASGGHGLISPHHFGFPHTRERFFIVASKSPLPDDPFPTVNRTTVTSLGEIIQLARELTPSDIEETTLTDRQTACIEHWNTFLRALPEAVEVPSFPLWSDELDASYPFEEVTPYRASLHRLAHSVARGGKSSTRNREALLGLLPSYARTRQDRFPTWKVDFIRQNREWFKSIRPYLKDAWIKELRRFPSSLRKLEWNCKGEERNLWQHVLQFRPSGLRVKRYTSAPALVAMTVTQIPILGPKKRFISRVEGLRLQGFSDSHALPTTRAAAFAALGNAVHVGVARAVAKKLIGQSAK